MCGIVGISGNGLDLVSRASEFISHRGPDDSGIFLDHDNKIGLAHRRLSIIDLSESGHQPMISSDGAVVIVFNGEIYNYKELRVELIAKGVRFYGDSDTEVLLNLYIAEGNKMLNRLNGIFAFSIWDSRSQTMLLARDGFGVKPLYYSGHNDSFAFSSEIKSLLSLTQPCHEIDELALSRYLSFLWCPGEQTPFRDIKKLQPGEALEVRFGKITRQWEWFDLPALNKHRQFISKQTAITGVVDHLREAVRRQMVSDAPLGAFLSGGLDSSSVVAFAREFNPNINCYTIKINGVGNDSDQNDLPFAQKVAQHLNVSLDIVEVSPKNIIDNLEKMVIQLDEPLADPAALNTFFISELAKSQGIKVLLSGVGGDDIFTGYRRHATCNFDGFIDFIPQGIRNEMSKNALSRNYFGPLSRRIKKVSSGIYLNGEDRLINYYKWISDGELLNLFTNDFRRTLGEAPIALPLFNFLKKMPVDAFPLEKMLSLEQRFFLGDHNLIYTDKMSMAAGVEVRVPFLDIDLVKFVDRIPLNMKQHFSTGKWVLKKAMEPYLPKGIIYRPKSGFGVPLREWMKHDLLEMRNDLLSPRSIKHRGYFDPKQVEQLLLMNDANVIDATYTIFSLMCIEIWCKNFIDSKHFSG